MVRSVVQKIVRHAVIALRFFGRVMGLFLVVVLIIVPLMHGWLLRHELRVALDNASSVKVIEHSFKTDRGFVDFDGKEITYATVELTPEQINSLRWHLPLTLDFSSYGMLKCIFEEHHYIQISEKDGSVVTLHICFHCGEIELGDHYGIMPLGWYYTLQGFIKSIGLHPDGPWDKYPIGPK